VWNFTPNWFEDAREYFGRAIALDRGYAAPFVGLAELFHIHASLRGELARSSASRIRPALEQALERDPDLAEAHAWRGVLASTYEHDWAEATRSFEKALATHPVAPRIRHIYGYFFLRFIGRAQEAVDEHRRALGEGDPLSLITRVGLVMSLFAAARRDEASHEARRLHDLAPDFLATHSLLAFDVVNQPLADALAFAERLHQLSPFSAGSLGLLAGLAARSGDLERAETLRRQFEPAEPYGNAVDVALYHLASGDVDRAFDAMSLLRDQRHPFLMMVLVGGPYGAQLRASPRWRDFARTIGLAE
jgi:Tfp pilus assembly protein PilF